LVSYSAQVFFKVPRPQTLRTLSLSSNFCNSLNITIKSLALTLSKILFQGKSKLSLFINTYLSCRSHCYSKSYD